MYSANSEKIHRKSIGLSESVNSAFLKENRICYASGNALVVVDVSEIIQRNAKKGANGNSLESGIKSQEAVSQDELDLKSGALGMTLMRTQLSCLANSSV